VERIQQKMHLPLRHPDPFHHVLNGPRYRPPQRHSIRSVLDIVYSINKNVQQLFRLDFNNVIHTCNSQENFYIPLKNVQIQLLQMQCELSKIFKLLVYI
jgi:hypothetical protein